jgi:hypothetical protein
MASLAAEMRNINRRNRIVSNNSDLGAARHSAQRCFKANDRERAAIAAGVEGLRAVRHVGLSILPQRYKKGPAAMKLRGLEGV